VRWIHQEFYAPCFSRWLLFPPALSRRGRDRWRRAD
jgi:hypothetical protein